MVPAVLRFIFARGHAKMRSKIMVVRHRDKQTSEQLLKKAIMRRLNELLLYGMPLGNRNVDFTSMCFFYVFRNGDPRRK